MDGFILVNKPKGITSHDVVAKLRKILKTRQVGHHGTLDPIATGLMIVGVNKACKAMKFINESDKTYIVTMKFGTSYDTLDYTGTLTDRKVYNNDISILDIENYFKKKLGAQQQKVPLYSAVKINGKKLYEYARNGEYVERPVKNVEIKSLNIIDFKDDLLTFEVCASKGFFVRVLCEDIGINFNYPAHMLELQRTYSNDFSLNEAFTLEQIECGNYDFISLEAFASSHFEHVELCDVEMDAILTGKPFNFSKGRVAYYFDNTLVALHEEDDVKKNTLRFRKE